MNGVSNGIWAIIPVRELAAGKQRLAGVLAAELRQRLIAAMLEDVLAAAGAAPGLAGIALATGDAEAIRLGKRYGAKLLADGEGLNRTLDAAAAALIAEGAGAIIVLPSDLPLVRPDEIGSAAARLAQGAKAVIAEAAADGGTNLIGFQAEARIPFRFGVGSFAAHCMAFRAIAVEPAIIEAPGLAFDVDRPDDVGALLRCGRDSRAGRVLIDAKWARGGASCREAS